LVSIISLLVIGGGFFVLKNWQKSSAGSNNFPPLAIEKTEKNGADTIKNQQESLWNSFPHAEELKLSKIEMPQSQPLTNTSPSAPQTPTDTLAQQLMNAYFSAAGQNSGSLSDEETNTIVNPLIENLNTSENRSDAYTLSDIKISKNEDEYAIKEYGNNLALTIKKYFDPIPEDEMRIFKTAVTNQDATELQKMEPLVNAYRNTAGEMLSLNVPSSFSENHLILINRFNDIAQDLDAIQKNFDDPVQSLIALNQYFTDFKPANQVFHDLNDYFSNKKIVFELNEPAEYFKENYQKQNG